MPSPGQRAREAYREASPDADPEALELAAALGAHAPALLPLTIADPSILDDIRRRPLDRHRDAADLRRLFAPVAALEDGPELHRALRRTRHRAMVRIALREILGLADIDRTAGELAALASAALDAALTACRRTLERRYGEARAADGPVPLTALGMGKLGGGELNFGSDVDLIFFYGTDDAEVGDGLETSVHELFTRLVRRATRALAEVTEDGFVFRVDLRLRPEGSRGPLANSLASAERYYESFGRDWERAALLRGRPIAGDPAFGAEVVEALRPFVFRRQVEPRLAEQMHELVRRSRRELAADPEQNVKLGRGGIREAEFFVQSLQLIWGGRHRELQVPGTIEGLRALRHLGLVSHADAAALEEAWALLRRVEHRIHMVAGYQTHDLPGDREELARSLGYADAARFEAALAEARAKVAALFDSLVERPDEEEDPLAPLLEATLAGQPADELVELVEGTLAVDDGVEGATHLARLARRASSPFGPLGHRERPALARLLLAEVHRAADPTLALRHMADFFLRNQHGFDAVLAEEPRLTRRLVGLFGASPGLAELLVGHPESLGRVFVGASVPSAAEIAEGHASLAELEDAERFVSELRRLKREHGLRIGLAHVGDELGDRATQRLLTALADAQVEAAFRFALSESERKLGATETPMAVVGMGKLGGGELGFTSDLDLIFVYDGDGETDRGRALVELFSRTAQRALRLLSQLDAEGPGYEIDTRLRPSGSQGLLVVSRAAFERYHAERAQAWERQALVRARVVASSAAAFAERVGAELAETAYARGAPDAARVAELRGRMQRELAGERGHRYHPKLGYGGLVDVEFVAQCLQMRHGGDASVRRRHTLDALDALAEGGYLAPGDAEALADGYRFFRSVEQTAALLVPALRRFFLSSSGT